MLDPVMTNQDTAAMLEHPASPVHAPRTRANGALRRIALFLVIAPVLLILSAQSAQARELTQGDRMAIGAIAEDAFPDSACYRQVHIAWQHHVTPAPDDPAAAAIAANPALQLAGYAYGVIDGSCNVGVRSDLDPVQACNTAVHEAGHLAGRRHGSSALMGSPDTDDPSHPGGIIAQGYVYPACANLIYLQHQRAVDWVWARSSDDTTVSCKRMTPSLMQCRSSKPARRSSAKRTRHVWRVWATSDVAIRGARIR